MAENLGPDSMQVNLNEFKKREFPPICCLLLSTVRGAGKTKSLTDDYYSLTHTTQFVVATIQQTCSQIRIDRFSNRIDHWSTTIRLVILPSLGPRFPNSKVTNIHKLVRLKAARCAHELRNRTTHTSAQILTKSSMQPHQVDCLLHSPSLPPLPPLPPPALVLPQGFSSQVSFHFLKSIQIYPFFWSQKASFRRLWWHLQVSLSLSLSSCPAVCCEINFFFFRLFHNPCHTHTRPFNFLDNLIKYAYKNFIQSANVNKNKRKPSVCADSNRDLSSIEPCFVLSSSLSLSRSLSSCHSSCSQLYRSKSSCSKVHNTEQPKQTRRLLNLNGSTYGSSIVFPYTSSLFFIFRRSPCVLICVCSSVHWPFAFFSPFVFFFIFCLSKLISLVLLFLCSPTRSFPDTSQQTNNPYFAAIAVALDSKPAVLFLQLRSCRRRLAPYFVCGCGLFCSPAASSPLLFPYLKKHFSPFLSLICLFTFTICHRFRLGPI